MKPRTLFGLCMTLGMTALFAASPAQAGQTTTQQTKGTPTVTTEQLRGEVVKVEGNNLVVKMSSGCGPSPTSRIRDAPPSTALKSECVT
jgi:hypothetical protein